MSKCEICGARAEVSVVLNLCRQCYAGVVEDLCRLAFPVPVRDATALGLMLADEYQRRGCEAAATWVARDKSEYDRGVALGMIEGWSSFEHYEASQIETLSQVPNVRFLDITPDEIVAALASRGLPNTTEGHERLYAELGAAAP